MSLDATAIVAPPVSLSARVRGFVRGISLRNFVVGFSAAIVIGVAYFAFAKDSSTASIVPSTISTVERRTIVSSIKAVGTVTFASEQKLKFNQKGTVASVRVAEGDIVKKGQILAELNKTTVQADVRVSQLSLEASRLQLEQLHADREKQVLAAQNNLASAERTVDQSHLALAKQQKTELLDLATTASDILIGSEKLLDSYYSVLTRDAAARPSLDIATFVIHHYLYRDYEQKHAVELSYYSAVNQAAAMRQTYGITLVTEQDPQVLLKALQDAQALAKALQELGEQSYDMMQGASTDSIEFPVTDLTTLRNTINTNRSTAAGYVADAHTTNANLESFSEEKGLIPSITIQEKENTLVASEEDQLVKQSTFQSTVTDLDISIRSKLNDIAQKSASFSKVAKTLDDYRIVAPFAGVARRVDFQVGDNLLADSTEEKYIVLENPDDIIITIPLDQVDVVRVKKGMSATIALDAIPGQQFQGKIRAINPTPTVTSGVVSYEVEIQLPSPKDLTILSGMTATVNVETLRKENVLVVPNLALSRSNATVSVTLGSGIAATVETGVTDGRFTEILSGVNEGDSVVSVNLASAQKSSTSATADQTFRNLGRLGGGGGPPGR